MSRLEAHLPNANFREFHRTSLPCSLDRARAATRELRASELSWIVKALFLVRALPMLLGKRPQPTAPADGPMLSQLGEAGFVMLDDSPEELVFGCVGRFWRPVPEILHIASASEYAEFDKPGFAKVAFNFRFTPTPRGTEVSTETRVSAASPASRRAFALYWSLIRLPSGMIRRLWLGAIRRKAMLANPKATESQKSAQDPAQGVARSVGQTVRQTGL
jgi:hypothetical protein